MHNKCLRYIYFVFSSALQSKNVHMLFLNGNQSMYKYPALSWAKYGLGGSKVEKIYLCNFHKIHLILKTTSKSNWHILYELAWMMHKHCTIKILAQKRWIKTHCSTGNENNKCTYGYEFIQIKRCRINFEHHRAICYIPIFIFLPPSVCSSIRSSENSTSTTTKKNWFMSHSHSPWK